MFALYLYYFYVYRYIVLITSCSSIYSHALYSINNRHCKFITIMAIMVPMLFTNCLYVHKHQYGIRKTPLN